MSTPKDKAEGLETVATVRLTTVYPSRNTSRVLREAFVCSENVKQSEELVTRSQAEDIIAAKDARIKELGDLVIIMTRWMPSGFGSYPDEKEVVKEIRKVYNGV